MKKNSNVFGNSRQHRPRIEQLECHDPDQPVIEQHPRDPKRRRARPVAHRRQVGDREVVDVERLIEALIRPVRPQIDAAELREQRVVDRVHDQRREDDQRDPRDQQRQR